MKSTNDISTCLWFDGQAEEAAQYYTSIFDDSAITAITIYDESSAEASENQEGDVMTVGFEIGGFSFVALNGGPHFKINPSISFILNFDPSMIDNANEKLEETWTKLADGGHSLMELGEYPFSPKYGWVQDKFGVSWQLMLTNSEGDDRPFITPSLMFTGDHNNKAEQAINFYTDTFGNSTIGNLNRYPNDTGPAKKGSVMYGDFMLKNTWIAAMDSGVDHDFSFNEAVSLVVSCENQEEIDQYWSALSAVSEAEQCGWLKDRYGVSWQIVPKDLDDLLTSEAATKAMRQMKKIDIEALKEVNQ